MNKVGMVILCYNNGKIIMENIKKMNEYKCIDTILIVDNSSTDKSYEVLKEIENDKIKIIKNDVNSGYAAGNNVGLKYLEENEYTYAFIMNPDVIVDNNSLNKIINAMKEDKEYAILGCIRTSLNDVYDQSQFWNIPEFIDEFRSYFFITRRLDTKKEIKFLKCENKIKEVGVVPGCLFLINLDIAEKVGNFDEKTFLYYEENILAKKIKNAGYKSGIVLNAKYIHNHQKSSSKNANQKFIKNNLYNSKKYYDNTYLKINRFQKMMLNILNKINKIERGIHE